MPTAPLALALAALLAAAATRPALAAPTHVPHAADEPHAFPEYKFEYSVHDPHTHDIKSQSEIRHGDTVTGTYSLVEPDGHVRKVDYSSDKHSGFQAVVQRAGKLTHHGYGELDAVDVGGAHGPEPVIYSGHF